MLTPPPSGTARPARRSGRLTLTLGQVWLTAALTLFALNPLLSPIPPSDFWWHLATGRAILAQGWIPTADSFSYTQFGKSFFNQPWLAQLLMYGLYQSGGLHLVIITQALVIALAYGLLLRLCLLRTGHVQLSVGLLVVTTLPLSFNNWLVRPQSYAFPLFAAFLTILTEYRLGAKNRLWLLPLLMMLWVNIHGSFVLGGVLIVATVAGEWLRRQATRLASRASQSREDVQSRAEPENGPALSPLLLWGAATALALLINPRGFEVIGYVRNLLGTTAVTSLITEWAPPTIRQLDGVIFFLFLCMNICVLIYSRRRPDPTDVILFFAFLWNALSARRNIVWFGFVATQLLAVQAATLIGTRRSSRRIDDRPTLNAVLMGVLGVFLAIALPWWRSALPPPLAGALVTEDTPVAAVAFLRDQSHRPRRLFHASGYGSYLIWQAPEQPVFIDPRIELYPIEQWRDYIDISGAKNAAMLLQRYDIDALLLDAVHQKPLIEFARKDGSWVERYKDDHTVYFSRAAR